MFPHPVLGFGGLGKPAHVHLTVGNRIFVAGARARRGRRDGHLIVPWWLRIDVRERTRRAVCTHKVHESLNTSHTAEEATTAQR